MGNVRFWTGKNVWLDGYKCEEKKVFQLYVVSYVLERCIVACAWISYGVFLDIYVISCTSGLASMCTSSDASTGTFFNWQL